MLLADVIIHQQEISEDDNILAGAIKKDYI